MNQSDFNTPSNDPRAQRIVTAIEEFVEEFDRRVPNNHGAKVKYKSTKLDGRKIDQKPERFIEETLIRRIADALKYEYRPQPKGFDGLNGRIPDFTVTNTDTTVIGEIKRPNKIKEAKSESVEYLDLANSRPLVGIATDGWTWILYTAKEGQAPTYTKHSPLRPLIRDIAREHSHERSRKRSRSELRRRCYEFVNEFGINQLSNNL